MTTGIQDSGKLEFLTIAALLKDAFVRKFSGQLVVSADETVKKIFLKNGVVAFSSSNQVPDRLGKVLARRGVISQQQLDESSRQVQVSGRKQGTILVQMGALTSKELFQGLISQVREIVLSLFEWEEGRYEIREGFEEEEEIITLRINPADLILEGVGRVARRERFRSFWNPRNLGLSLHPSPPVLLEELNLPLEIKKLLSLLERNIPWGEIPSLIGRDETDAVALLYALTVLEVVATSVRPAPTAPSPPRAAEREAGNAPAKPAKTAPDEVGAESRDPETVLQRRKILELHGKLDQLSHYQILDLRPEATSNEIKRAYISKAKEFHPDCFFHSDHEDLEEATNVIFMKINEAYNVLYHPGRRAEYDKRGVHPEVQPGRAETDRESRIAEEQCKKGIWLLNSGENWAAVEALRWAVNLNPQNPLAHTYLGVALTQTKKRLHEAEEHCKTAIALDYNNPQFYVHLGQVYKTGRLPQKARKQFEMALKLNPRHPQALKELERPGPAQKKGRFINKIFKK
jgi:tetratricopeptide (TPR) repeat protein